MLLHRIGLLLQDPLEFLRLLVTVAFSLAVAITVHEFSHAFTAYRLGDDTARRLGRVSLNPLVHLDPLGTLLLLVIGFGWGKPVPVDPRYLRHPARWSMAAVSFSGACANLMTAALVGLLARFTLLTWPDVLTELLVYVVVFNTILAVFNLIPIPPLDGSSIAAALLPYPVTRFLSPLARYGPVVLLVILLVDSFTGLGVLWNTIGWAVRLFSNLVLGFSPL